jgi:DNA-binding HxlR family transcriptional regulator/predicted transcriptional regulator
MNVVAESSSSRSSFEPLDAAVFNVLRILTPHYLPLLEHLTKKSGAIKFRTLQQVFESEIPGPNALKRRLRNLISAGLLDKSHYSYTESNYTLKPKGEAVCRILGIHGPQNIPKLSDPTQFLLFRNLPSEEEFTARELAMKTGLCGHVKIARILNRFQALGYVEATRSGLRQTFYASTKYRSSSKAFLDDLALTLQKERFIETKRTDEGLIGPALLYFLNNRSSLMLEILREISSIRPGVTFFSLAEALLLPIYKVRELVLELEQMGLLRSRRLERTQDRTVALTKRGKLLLEHIGAASRAW